MTISNATLSSDVFTTVRSVLVDAAIKVSYTNKEAQTKYKSATVLAQYNDKSPSVPQIIIMPAGISEDNFKFGYSEGKKFININVECYYKTTKGVDELSDAVKVAIKDACEDGTIVGMDLLAISEDYAFVNPNDMKFHLKTLTLTFDRE